jgi:hypothetical protein
MGEEDQLMPRGRAPLGPDGRPRVGYAQRSSLPGAPGGGVSGGLLNGARPGQPGTASVLTGNGGIGGWVDGQGVPTYGAEVSGALGRFAYAPGNPALGGLGVEGAIGSGQLGVSANRSTLSMGAQANIFEAGATMPFRASALTGRDDHSVRGALSVGAGVAGRVHYGDDDGDGVPEMGFGADIGVGPFGVGFDVRSETLGRAYQALTRMFGRRNNR